MHIVARDKDVTVRLLEASGLPFEVLRMGGSGAGRRRAASELIWRSWALRKRIRRFGIKVVLTRNPSGAIAAFGTSATSIFDTDDGRNVGVHYWLARPFAGLITSSEFDPENHGRRHRRYRALKAQMFLHPDQFTPNPAVRRRYLGDEELLAVVRFSAHDASHDSRITGIDPAGRRAVIERLGQFGPTLLSVENEGLRLQRGSKESVPVAPEDFHHLLATAVLFVGDSQSVAAEAAILGVPALRLSSFSNRVFYLRQLQALGLMKNFLPGEEDALVAALNEILQHSNEEQAQTRNLARTFHQTTCDLRRWYLELVLDTLRRKEFKSNRRACSDQSSEAH